MSPAAPTRVAITDANVLINLMHVGRLDFLGALTAFECVVPDHVVAEITVPLQRRALDKALASGASDVRCRGGWGKDACLPPPACLYWRSVPASSLSRRQIRRRQSWISTGFIWCSGPFENCVSTSGRCSSTGLAGSGPPGESIDSVGWPLDLLIHSIFPARYVSHAAHDEQVGAVSPSEGRSVVSELGAWHKRLGVPLDRCAARGVQGRELLIY